MNGVKIKNVSAQLGKGKHIFRQLVTSDNFCLFVSKFAAEVHKYRKYRKSLYA